MKSPAFQVYPKDFLSDENVELMTNQQLGCYWKLICRNWIEGSIPADIAKIAKLCQEDASAMAELWPGISPCFVEAPGKPGRLINPRLEEERQKQEAHRQERSESGAKGAKARWAKASGVQGVNGSGTDTANGSAIGSAITEPKAADSIASPSSSALDKTNEQKEEEAHSEFVALVNRHFPKWHEGGDRYRAFLDYSDRLPWVLMVEAVRETLTAGITRLSYCDAICADWVENGLQTLADLDIHRKRRAAEKEGSGRGPQHHGGSTGPDRKAQGPGAHRAGHPARPGAAGGVAEAGGQGVGGFSALTVSGGPDVDLP